MKILHIASFNGNIGDHANHAGFRKSFKRYIGGNPIFDELEIREFYHSWGMRHFDETFVKEANNYDLIVFGGGNFCELCWDYSTTGTTIDLAPDLLRKVEVPVLFNGMGVDDKGGRINPENIRKFGYFLEALIEKRSLITVRNDGSREIMKKYYSETILNHVLRVPDGGFFVEPKAFQHVEIPEGKRIISINLAGDAEKIRFSEIGGIGRLTKQEFMEDCAASINWLLEKYEDIHIVMTAHIFQDFGLCSEVIKKIKDPFVRRRISTAPYLNGSITDGEYIIDLYRKSILTIGMRYHANICAIAVNTPTIGIVNFPKHKKMYEDIGLENRMVASDEQNFKSRLCKKIEDTLFEPENKKLENQILLARLEEENEDYFKRLKELLY